MVETERAKKVLLAIGVAAVTFGAAVLFLTRDMPEAEEKAQGGKGAQAKKVGTVNAAGNQPMPAPAPRSEEPELDYSVYNEEKLQQLVDEIILVKKSIIARSNMGMISLKHKGQWNDDSWVNSTQNLFKDMADSNVGIFTDYSINDVQFNRWLERFPQIKNSFTQELGRV